MNERSARWPLSVVVLTGAALSAVLSGCSSSGSSPAASPPAVAVGTASSSTSSTPATDPVQTYLDAVNKQCDALLPKVVAATHGGSINVPVHTYLATWPAHERLLAGFDAHIAAITVPAAARSKSAVLVAYVHFADQLDSARLAAAHKGEAAYRKEVKAESGAENDPRITALTAAGFNQSCTAR